MSINRKAIEIIISEMLDNPDESGIYPTTKCFDALEKILNEKDAAKQEAIAKPKLTASEAIYGFTAWLTTRKEKTVMSAAHECSCCVDLIRTFIKANNLADPHENWADKLVHPKE